MECECEIEINKINKNIININEYITDNKNR